MIRLFELDVNDKGLVSLNKVELFLIPNFKKLITRDKGSKGDSDGRNKLQARRELAYIWYTLDFASPLIEFTIEDRHEKALKYCELTDNSIDKEVKNAINTYKELQFTRSRRLLEDSFKACDTISKFFREVDLTKVDDFNKPIHKATDLMRNLKEVSNVIEGLKNLEKLVIEESTNKERIRGGSKRGNREDPQ